MKRFIVMIALVLSVIGTSCLSGQGKGKQDTDLEWTTARFLSSETYPTLKEVTFSFYTFGDTITYMVEIGFHPTDMVTKYELLLKGEAITLVLLDYFEDKKRLPENGLEPMEKEILEIINTHVLTEGKARAVRMSPPPRKETGWW